MQQAMLNNQTVYIVDDDDAARQSLEFLLKSHKLTVQTYESAIAFLAALPSLSVGCVITDVRMPGMSGIELLKRLKTMANTVPVIVITGHGDVPLAGGKRGELVEDFRAFDFPFAVFSQAI